MKHRKICGTCGFLETKIDKRNEMREGYCYGMPPGLGFTRPKVRTTDRACNLHLSTEDTECTS